MTVELGNINKGIPMGSYAPGEGGGGGTAKVTGVDPIAVTNGSVAIKIDEQTLQVNEQGELAANLDEIGNELNDLSGRVTAAEADILKKQDTLTPVAPVTINKYVKSNLHGFSFTTDGTGVYATSGKSLSYSNFDNQSQGKMIFRDNTLISNTDESWACYIDVPISLGQVVKFPVPDASNYYYPMCILGKTDATGHFYVITHGYALSYNRCSASDDSLAFDGNYVYSKNRLDYSSTRTATSIVQNQDPYTGFVQLFEDAATGEFSIQMHKCQGASNGVPYYCTAKYVISDNTAIARFKEINTVRIVPRSSGAKAGKAAASAISVSSIGLYNCNTDLFSLNNDMSQFDTGNLFEIAGETAHNYLELNIGDGLAVQDNKLVCTVEAPDAYTKAEANTLLDNKATKAEVAKKQNAVEAAAPLSISNNVIKNYRGMTIVDDKISSVGGQVFSASSYSTFTIGDGNVAPPNSYIEMPYKSGQVVQVPTNTYNNANGQLAIFFGSWQDDGNFLVTAAFTPEDSYKVSNGCYGGLFNDGPIAIPSMATDVTIKSYSNVSEKAQTNISKVPDGNSYFQLMMSDDMWAIQLYTSGLTNNTARAYTWVIYDSNIGSTKFDTITEKTNTCLVMMNNSALKVATESIGLYDWGSRLAWTQEGYLNFLANKGDNLFNFETQGDTDSLSLSIGDGLSITDGKLTATGGGSTSVEKYGIEGDYSSRYGILECPNGIFTVSDMTMTLQPGVVMQCAGSESKTTNSSAMAHTVTATSDFDIFYTSGQFIEATKVVFSTEEPDDGDTGYIAWWDPSREDKKWQFKSNDTGNVWAAAAACRLAHVHTDGTTITRVDYIGNRQMDDSVFVDASTLDGISFKKLTQSAYDALDTPDANTLYIIVG